jgi:hypothetical protein
VNTAIAKRHKKWQSHNPLSPYGGIQRLKKGVIMNNTIVQNLIGIVYRVLMAGMILIAGSWYAQADDKNWGSYITDEARAEYMAQDKEGQEKAMLNLGENVGKAHAQMAYDIGADIRADALECQVPMSSAKEFKKYFVYRMTPLNEHAVNHIIEVVEALYQVKVPKSFRTEMVNNLSSLTISDFEKMTGLTFEDVYKQLKDEANCGGI